MNICHFYDHRNPIYDNNADASQQRSITLIKLLTRVIYCGDNLEQLKKLNICLSRCMNR
jgi:hypothetical protein